MKAESRLEAINKIIESLKMIGPLPRQLEKALRDLLKIRRVPRKHVFLKPGQTSKRVYFIVSGLLRGYYLDEKNREKTAWIMKELDAIISVGSFFEQVPGDEYIEALEPATVGSISYAELQMLYRKFPEFNWHGRILTERYYVLADRRAKELRSNDATKRYQIFTEQHPDLLKRVSTIYIASYLGIKKETLYRIRGSKYNTGKK